MPANRALMKFDRAPIIVAASVIVSGALLSWALGAPPVGIFVMTAAAVAAVLAVVAGPMGAERSEHPQTPHTPSPQLRPSALHHHPGFSDLVDALPFPLLIVSDGQIAAANIAAKALLGDFIVSVDVRLAVRHPAAGDLLTHQNNPAQSNAVDLVGIGRPGQRWQMRVMPLASGALLVTLEDQTAHDAVERMRADFVANASHELRTPLAVIIGTLETLLEPDAGADAVLRQRFLTSAEIEARRMLQLVEDLLSISRIEASKGSPPTDPVDLSALCQSVIAELVAGDSQPERQVILNSVQAPLVPGDQAQLSQMLHNLISNALNYGGDRYPVTVTIAITDNDMAELSIVDRGEGIAKEHLPRLTERFYRVDSARSRAQGGTGLGLAIAKHIVQRHHGRMEIDSELGVGTTVRVRLPLLAIALRGSPAKGK